MELATACWPDLTGRIEVLLVPLGSCEQHGPHLPFLTDAAVADAVARHAATKLTLGGLPSVCAPVLPYGASGEHQQFPGTVSIGHEVLAQVIVELGRSASTWVQRIVFVNGHGGNLPTVATAVQQLRAEGRDAAWLPCLPRDSDAHAGRTETSLMQAIAPSTVRLTHAVAGPTDSLRDLLPRMREGGVIAVSPNGVLGDPAGSSSSEGQALLAEMVSDAVESVLAWMPGADGRLRIAVPMSGRSA